MRRAGIIWPLLVVFAACSSSGSTGGGAGSGGTSSTGGAGCGADAGVAPCGAGQVCVEKHHVAGPTETVSYDCAPNPCAAGTTSCTCAASLCASDPTLYCASASEERVTCGSKAQ
jgi:hypothetical protein